MSFAVIASDQEAPVSPDTDLADALAVAPRVANERGCKVQIVDNATGEERYSFVPDSPPQPPAQEPTDADREAAGAADGANDPDDMTVDELDAAFGDIDGYPKSENKKAKIAFAKKQG